MNLTFDNTPLTQPLSAADKQAYKAHKKANRGMKDLYQIVLNVILVIFIFFDVITLITSLVGLLTGDINASIWRVLFLFLIFAAGVGVLIWMRTRDRQRARVFAFARRNNLHFLQNTFDPPYAGMIFDNGYNRMIDTALQFSGGIEIGNFSYDTGGRKHKRTHAYAYAKIKLPRRLPHMVLDARKNNHLAMSSLSDSFDRSQKLSLEGNFDTYFTLYAPKEYERDALYVFTPDVMAAMIDYGQNYDIEVVEDELYLYKRGFFPLHKPDFYAPILAVINSLHSELVDQTDYYSDQRVGSRAKNVVAAEGRRLKANGGLITTIIVCLLLMAYSIYSALQ